ncbi:nuclear factor of kappa light polypeptide gene enhancer in B-cells [Nesidiocoris tenuis]|uniref:Nuclear factor of kappa light polypeptide gene enhancer in B-cells n=1 Tax=Nesidiocoris tenuis TaxID=355587 RepID=A0ABN7ASY7_9HEMI|nr:nuclear factor of kappa light polypeptide gene enhancer in B-cells [Nesidiocoris tenuis]
MVLRCAVPGCSSVKYEGSTKLFFAAPQQESVRRHWFEVLSMPYISDDPVYICVDHFEVEDNDEDDEKNPGESNGASSIKNESDKPKKAKKRKTATELPPDAKKKPIQNSTTHSELDIGAVKIEQTKDTSSEEDNAGWDNFIVKMEPGENPSDPQNSVRSYITNIVGRPLTIQSRYSLLTDSEKPFLEFIEQPERLYRFRYQRESNRPHGPLKGRLTTNETHNKFRGPKVQLFGYTGPAVLRCWLFCGDWPSPHQLVSTERNGGLSITYEPHDSLVDEMTSHTATFDRLNILHVVCNDPTYQDRYLKKILHSLSNQYLPSEELPLIDHNSMKELLRRQEKDIVCLFVEAFAKTDDGYKKLCHTFSDNIKNGKSPKTNDLSILKQSHDGGPCSGQQRVLIFTSKMIRSVAVEFYEKNERGQITWRSLATMSKADFHKQVALSFLTPPYKSTNITSPVTVSFRLVRSTDGAVSNSCEYTYWPTTQGCIACSPSILTSRARK